MNGKIKIAVIMLLVLGAIFVAGCVDKQATSDSGVQKTSVKVSTGTDGLTTEQRNIRDRLVHDNRPGAMEYLYIFSSYSGQVLYTDVVKGKVTSSGKRLTPYNVEADSYNNGMDVIINGEGHRTPEVLQDDGTYGSSVEYLFYWDTKGVYHQIYISGGQLVIITDQPISLNGVTMNIAQVNGTK